MFKNIVKLAHSVFGSDESSFWNGYRLIAFDGSKYTLPNSWSLKMEFEPKAGFENPGKGHFPQCLVETAYDAISGFPVAISVDSIEGSERLLAEHLFSQLPDNSLVIEDRGYPSFRHFHSAVKAFGLNILVRCPATNTFSAVMDFVKSGLEDAEITLPVPESLTKAEKQNHTPIKLRAIRYENHDKTISVLLTTLFDIDKYSAQMIRKLYRKRWKVETHFRNEKVSFQIEKFHARTVNGILQEIYASGIMAVLGRLLAYISGKEKMAKPQLKNAVLSTGSTIGIFIQTYSSKIEKLFVQLLKQISKVLYYKPKKERMSQARINKSARNKWQNTNRLGSQNA
jgi:hypothetical protein